MPTDLRSYPPYWKQFSRFIVYERAHQQCECRGQCGLHGGAKGQRRCTEVHRRPANWFKGTVHLSTAHLCDCEPPCALQHHVIAACQRCHLRIDVQLHQRHMRERGTAYKPDWLNAPDK